MAMLQQAQDNVARGQAGKARGDERGHSDASNGQATASQWEALNKRMQKAATRPDTKRAMEQEILKMAAQFEPPRIADLLMRVHAADAMRSSHLLDELCQTLMPRLTSFGNSHLVKLTSTLTAWALQNAFKQNGGKVQDLAFSEELKTFCSSVSSEVSLRLSDVAPGDLSRITTALSSVNLSSSRLFSSIARAAAGRSERFQAKELVDLCVAFERSKYYHTPLLDIVAKGIKVSCKDLIPRDVVKGMQALASSSFKVEESLAEVIAEHIPKKVAVGALSAEEFCSLAWACCTLDIYSDKLFRAVFKALENAPSVRANALCELYEIHVSLKASQQDAYKEYELDDAIVQGLREHYKQSRNGLVNNFRLDPNSEKVHVEVRGVLEKIMDGIVRQSVQSSPGMIVDFVISQKKSSKAIAILELDGPQVLVRSLDSSDSSAGQATRVRGSATLKRKVLQRSGLKVAVVQEQDWLNLEEDRKKSFLREILKKAGVSEDRFV